MHLKLMGEVLLENQVIPLLKVFLQQLIKFIKVLRKSLSAFQSPFSESQFDCSYVKGF